MNMQKRILSCAIAVSLAALSACGGDTTASQDVGSDTTSPSRALAARAVDGYLAGATAFVDLNENGTLDAFEPRAVTDVDGFFSYNHLTGVDYCALPASNHCLKAAVGVNDEVLIRVSGGYDTVSGLPFKGTLSVRSSELDRGDLRLVTPQTSMIADSQVNTQEKIEALIRAGLLNSNDSLGDDHIGDTLGPQATRAQMATILARVLGMSADLSAPAPAFEDVDENVEAWHLGYIGMATQLAGMYEAGGSAAFEEVFATTEALERAMRDTAYAKQHPGESAPASFVLPNEAAATSLLQFTAGLVALSEELIAAMQAGSTTPAELKAALRVLSLAAERGLNDPTDTELSDLFAWVRTQLAQGNGLGSDLTGLGAERVDLNALIDPSFDFDPSSNSISANAVIPFEAASAFASIANTAFHVTVNKDDERGAGLIFMSGQSGSRDGELKLCVRYRDADGDFDTSSSTDPNGAMLINGRWSLLNDYTLTMNAEVAGGVRPLFVKSVGVSGSDLKYRFDFGSDPSEWTGAPPSGFAAGAVPTNDAECRSALLQKFGPAS